MSWSPWMDLDEVKVKAPPESPGVYMVHAGMKILYIGSSDNLRRSLPEAMADPCIGRAKRLRYMVTESPESTKEQLLKDYLEKHGRLPECNEKRA